MTPKAIANEIYERLQAIGVNPGRANKLAMFSAIKDAPGLTALEAENARLAAEHTQCHEQNMRLVGERMDMKGERDALAATCAALQEALRDTLSYAESPVTIREKAWAVLAASAGREPTNDLPKAR